jgi:ABC-type Zn uptake system ZnuABC Zn-binding protein ZnuA
MKSTTALMLAVLATVPLAAADRLQVVTTMPDYAWLTEQIGGDRVDVRSIAAGNQDVHFIRPRPSYSALMRKADLFVTTGLDLELWVPTLLDTAGNRRILEGSPGYVAAWPGVPLQDIPTIASRTEGDVHLYGNPHIQTNPLNMINVSKNILDGLKRVDPDSATQFEANASALADRLYRRTFGDELVELLGGKTLANLSRNGRLREFLANREYPRNSGRMLLERLGGWLKQAEPLQGRKIVGYHKNWIYLAELLELDIRGYIEPKPGIPPTPRHVEEIMNLIEKEEIEVILTASYFDPVKPTSIAKRTGARAVVVPMGSGVDGIKGYDRLVQHWIDSLLEAFEAGP